MSAEKLYVTPPMLARYTSLFDPLRDRGVAVAFNPGPYPLDPLTLAARLDSATIALVGLDRITDNLLEACPSLYHVARNGVGLDNVDLEAATRRGLIVTCPLGANSTSVAELTLGLLVAVARQIVPGHQALQQGAWKRELGTELMGKTMGIIGLGRIGKKVALRAQAFEMRVIANDILPDPHFAGQHGIPFVPFADLLAASDVVSLHVPLTPLTQGMMNAAAFARMKPGALLLNTARGRVVDPAALAAALDSGHVAGAGLDAHADETSVEPELVNRPNVITTPHVGGYTRECLSRTTEDAVRNMLAVLDGRTPPGLINPEAWPPRRRTSA